MRRLTCGALAALAGLGLPLVTAGSASASPSAPVVVRSTPGHDAAAAVRAVGGTVTRRLGIIGGVSARVPASSLERLRQVDGVVEVTEDAPLHLQGSTYDPATDAGSLTTAANVTQASQLWDQGITGKGVDVALIDSGVTRVAGLDASGKVVDGPDLSFDSQSSAKTRVDGYGHGTHMAGIIGGHDPGDPTNSADRTPGRLFGMAPDARLVNMKVADANGATDVSQVIAALDWVVQHKASDGLNIRVVNLSFGTDSTQSYRYDPLAFAAEQAWKAGIVVVASAGNGGGSGPDRLTDPASDPFVLAVAAMDANGTTDPRDDSVPSFSERGDGTRNPDVAAPGVSVTSLRVPGSYLDQKYPGAARADRFFKGSGTSQAAAMASGAAALLVSAHPAWTPDQVKVALLRTGRDIAHLPATVQGSGLVSIRTANVQSANGATQTFAASVGTGTLEGSRGSLHVTSSGKQLSGEQDIFGKAFDASSMAAAEAQGSSWAGGSWNGSSWAGSSWAGSSWAGSSWAGTSWAGSSWAGSSWAGCSWAGASWAGERWG